MHSFALKFDFLKSLACLITGSTKKTLTRLTNVSYKCPTSEEQTCEQEADLERSTFFYLSALIVGTQCIAYLLVVCTQPHRTQTPTLTLWK